jgi:hypothetical protein
MGSSSKKRQTMAKMTRERTLQERRAQKQQKKDEKKAARSANGDGTVPSQPGDDETGSGLPAPAETETSSKS